jgi:serine/threonine protein kinase
MPIPSEELVGLSLNDDWKVVEKISKHITSTGGSFSCGYKVECGKKIAYLKALDFSAAFSHPDPARILQDLTESYNFERDLLKKCKDNKLSKIVTPISDGSVDVPGYSKGISKVYYIIFNLANGDIRRIKDTFNRLDLAFSFRALHNTAVGLEQLHRVGIAHQDLKPSNVLGFKSDYKISDLGRSSDSEKSFLYDDLEIPGDRNYAPLEQQYEFHYSDKFTEKFAADMFLFGSLFFFFFTGLSASQALSDKSKSMHIIKTNDFQNDIAEWERAFTEVLIDLKKSINPILPSERVDEVLRLVQYSCNPDPRKRGHQTNIKLKLQQYGLERFISRLDILAKEAELGIL